VAVDGTPGLGSTTVGSMVSTGSVAFSKVGISSAGVSVADGEVLDGITAGVGPGVTLRAHPARKMTAMRNQMVIFNLPIFMIYSE
jgi:hypothetical protein